MNDEVPHKIIIYIRAEIQEVLKTGECSGQPKHGERDLISFSAESLDDAKKKLSDFLFLGRRFFTQ